MVKTRTIETLLATMYRLDATRIVLSRLQDSVRLDDKQALVAYMDTVQSAWKGIKGRLIKEMPKAQNYMLVSRSWYAIRFFDGSRVDVKVLPIPEKNLFPLERTGRGFKDLSEAELDCLCETAVDQAKLKEYHAQIEEGLGGIMETVLGRRLDLIPIESMPQPVVSRAIPKVSAHAGRRWTQRILGITQEASAEEHRRGNWADVEGHILQAFATAELIWVGEDSTEYWLDDNNMVYVVGTTSGRTIVTVYEEDFGFSKEINRTIILQQVEVLAQCKGKYHGMSDQYNRDKEAAAMKRQELQGNLAVLKAEVSSVEKELSMIDANLEHNVSLVRLEGQKYEKELNKLFGADAHKVGAFYGKQQ